MCSLMHVISHLFILQMFRNFVTGAFYHWCIQSVCDCAYPHNLGWLEDPTVCIQPQPSALVCLDYFHMHVSHMQVSPLAPI